MVTGSAIVAFTITLLVHRFDILLEHSLVEHFLSAVSKLLLDQEKTVPSNAEAIDLAFCFYWQCKQCNASMPPGNHNNLKLGCSKFFVCGLKMKFVRLSFITLPWIVFCITLPSVSL